MSQIEQYKKFKSENLDKITDIVSKFGELIEETHLDLIEEMKGVLGASAANESTDDESNQEDALSIAESWVADNCSGGGLAEDVAMALWLRGLAEGELYLSLNQKRFYVWHDSDCQNMTHSRSEAILWCNEFKADGFESYVVDENNDYVETSEQGNEEKTPGESQ